MVETDAFRSWLERVQAGDPRAAAEFVRRYEPKIQEAIRVRLISLRLYRVLDATDICQSVLGNFFQRAAVERFTVESPGRLLALLLTMARHRVQDEARKQQARRRDHRRIEEASSEYALDTFMAGGPTPSKIVAGQELLEEIRRRLSPEERDLLEERALGRDWSEIARERGAHPDTLRKKLSRATGRVLRDLGLEEQYVA
jgi:RNA polymerase sigma factor (sigma-70 family)